MEAKKMHILIKANFKNVTDKAITKKGLMLQYFDLRNNQWVALVNDLIADSGRLDVIIRIADLAKLNPDAYSMMEKVMGGNSVPIIRLMDGATANQEWTVVYSLYPVTSVDIKGDLNIDFGDLWILDKNNVNRHIKGAHPNVEFTIGAFPRPNGNHAFFRALQFSLLNAEQLSDYNPKLFDLEITPKGQKIDQTKKIEELQSLLDAKQVELESKLKEIEDLEAKITDSSNDDDTNETENNDNFENSTEQASTTKKDVEARPAREVYTTIVDEVKSASDRLENTPYTLSNISLNLKTHVTSDGDGFKLQLVDAATAKDALAGTISDVKIDIDTKKNVTPPVKVLTAPNIIGLTETAARSRLKAFGLKMKVIYQSSKTNTIGQAFKQSPAPGNDISNGDTIITIFAKHSDKFN